MRSWRKLFLGYLRWRHFKGYGVHSPYAYSLVEQVINPGPDYGYYGYSEIEKLSGREGNTSLEKEQFAKFLLRLLAVLDIKEVIANIPLPVITLAALQSVGAEPVRFPFPPRDLEKKKSLFLLEGISTVPESVFTEYVPLLCVSPKKEVIKEIRQKNPGGVLFIDRDIILYLPRGEMAFVEYECRLGR